MKQVSAIVIAVAFSVMLGTVVYAAGMSDELFSAVEKNDIQKVRELITKSADVNVKEEHGNTPLIKAAGRGYAEIAELLIAKGADVNAQSWSQGNTPLILAASFGRLETTKLLIAKGADVNAKTKQGQTPLMGAAYSGYIDVATVLLGKGCQSQCSRCEGGDGIGRGAKKGYDGYGHGAHAGRGQVTISRQDRRSVIFPIFLLLSIC
jgi:ankyrin repeat protein